MLLKLTIFVTVLFLGRVASLGYVLPSSGTASTTQFYLGPELSGGTACGVDALPNEQSTSGKQGGGPGYLYVVSLLLHKSHELKPRRLQSTNSHLAPIPLSQAVADQALRAAYATGSHL